MDEPDHKPIEKTHADKQPNKLLWILLALLLAAVVGYGVYVWQQNEIRSLQSQINSLQEQVDNRQQTPPSPSPNSGQETPTDTTEYTSQKGVKVKVTAPKANSVVANPLAVNGEVKGSWSFEATFPVEITDNKKTKIAESYATLQGDWMTDNNVPFTAKLEFTRPAEVSNGFLILRNANPSGLPDKADYVEIPIKF